MSFQSITPNLLVADMSRSIAFYRDVLGFRIEKSVPEDPAPEDSAGLAPYVFAWMKRDQADVFLNDAHENPPTAGGLSMYAIVSDIDELFAAVQPRATVVMPMTTQFYGMREFAITDPDGYLLTFAQRD